MKKKDYVKEEKIKSLVKKEWKSKVLINDILGYIYNLLRLLDLKISHKKVNENEYLNIKEKTDDLKVINLINLLLKEKFKNNSLQEKSQELEKKSEENSLDEDQINQEKKVFEQEIYHLDLNDDNKSYFQNEVSENIESKIKSLSFDDLFKILNSQIGLINL